MSVPLKVGSPCPSPTIPQARTRALGPVLGLGCGEMFFVDHLGIQPVSNLEQPGTWEERGCIPQQCCRDL